ncbi:phage minor tail protein L [Shinella zoogloeoides]|uniref:phage minor tail protein L n=1 Tax=Shinella zoogloeoides TaxID=352475 RepID=UPI00273CFD7F|nr:phage minor tail protein L [Shinella zoogloeoides]WLR91006.1 phage minor tail protein L [Shinella zoogloeoides]
MVTLYQAAQSLTPDPIVSLFTLDTSSIGGPLVPFVQGREADQAVSFGNVEYQALDCEFTGMEVSGVGALPTPTIRVANHDGIIQSILNTWGDVLGCPIYRMRTFARFLDNGSEPDSESFYGPDQFRIERLVAENPVYLEWELSTAIDQEGKLLPGRPVIRDTCLWRYRAYNASTNGFDYSKAQCRYAGNKFYDINDQEVSEPSLDVPSRRISCCEARFGKGNPLPFGGFPGVARVRA